MISILHFSLISSIRDDIRHVRIFTLVIGGGPDFCYLVIFALVRSGLVFPFVFLRPSLSDEVGDRLAFSFRVDLLVFFNQAFLIVLFMTGFLFDDVLSFDNAVFSRVPPDLAILSPPDFTHMCVTQE